jgi:hypothetical protein
MPVAEQQDLQGVRKPLPFRPFSVVGSPPRVATISRGATYLVLTPAKVMEGQ